MSKSRIERPFKFMILRGEPKELSTASSEVPSNKKVDEHTLPEWQALVDDTRVNERERRKQIHAKLAGAGSIAPSQVTRWLYKNVLHADIDDPYLGLGPYLFASYPFKDDIR